MIGAGKIVEGDIHRKSWERSRPASSFSARSTRAQEFPVATQPPGFARNGTFMVWRKLRQDVPAFAHRDAAAGKALEAGHRRTDDEEAYETVCAKLVGRWRSGVPLLAAPSWADHQRLMVEWADCIEVLLRKPRDSVDQTRLAAFAKMLTGFRYGDDLEGARCPFGAHIRRANPRDMLDPELSATHGIEHAHQPPPHPAPRAALCRSRLASGA